MNMVITVIKLIVTAILSHDTRSKIVVVSYL